MSLYLAQADQTIPIGVRFVSRYSGWWGSDEPGTVLRRDRWRVEVRIDGYNGAGGYWITEFWIWDSSGDAHHAQPRSLSLEESGHLEAVYRDGAPP